MKALSVLFIINVVLYGTWFLNDQKIVLIKKQYVQDIKIYQELVDAKDLLISKDHSSYQDNAFNQLSSIIDSLNLKDKVDYIRPDSSKIDIAVKNISQNEMILFLNKLHEIKQIRLPRAQINQTSERKIILNLTLRTK